jgi:hypothetical protein
LHAAQIEHDVGVVKSERSSQPLPKLVHSQQVTFAAQPHNGSRFSPANELGAASSKANFWRGFAGSHSILLALR